MRTHCVPEPASGSQTDGEASGSQTDGERKLNAQLEAVYDSPA